MTPQLHLNSNRLAACLVLVLTLGTLAARRTPPKARETVDIAVEDAAAPWSKADGTGYANDVVRAAFDAVGIDARLHVLPYARCKQSVLAGRYVACVSMSPAPELRDSIIFSRRPLFTFTCDFIVRRGTIEPRRIEDLPRGSTVGLVIGYEYPNDMVSRLQAQGVIIEQAPSEVVNLRKVAAGRLTAVAITRDSVKIAAGVIARAGVTGRVAPTFNFGSLPGYIGFSVTNPSGRALSERFNEGYDRIVANGTYTRIQRRWMKMTNALVQ